MGCKANIIFSLDQTRASKDRSKITRFGDTFAIAVKRRSKRCNDATILCQFSLCFKARGHHIKRTICRPPVGRDCGYPALMLNNVKYAADPVSRSFICLDQTAIAKWPLTDCGIKHVGQADVSGEIG